MAVAARKVGIEMGLRRQILVGPQPKDPSGLNAADAFAADANNSGVFDANLKGICFPVAPVK
jgi:hypothetical protein